MREAGNGADAATRRRRLDRIFENRFLMMQLTQKTGRNAPCPCGSGKKFKQCCSGAGAPRAAASSDQIFATALRSFQSGNMTEAIAGFRRVLAGCPDHPGANYLLGYHALQSGDPAEAARLMGRAMAAGLRDAAAFYHHGVALAALGLYADAAFQFARAVAQKPDFEEARLNLANARFELGAFPEAGEQYRILIGRNPAHWKAHHNLAHVHYCLGDVEEAIGFFRRTIAENPGHAEAHASFAAMLELNNQPQEAEEAARRALALQPGNASAHGILAKCLRRGKRYDEALATLDSIDPRTASERTYVTLHNERGQNLDRLGRHEEAYQAFAASKRALAGLRNIRHDPLREFEPLAAARRYFTPQKMAVLRELVGKGGAGPSMPVPVFVTGFHRSGTTLIEQALSCHPQVGAAGELEAIPRLLNGLCGGAAGLPATLDTLLARHDPAPLLEFRAAYLADLTKRANATGQRWVIDKSLFNMLHLPLIRLLFPGSPVIHALRHPMDAVLSVHSQNFLWGNDWSLTMADTARAFQLTWSHVDATAPRLEGLHYLRCRYEDMIADTEAGIRAMLAFIGADYDPACLRFHENGRVARTASYEQISRPVYSTSVGRYLDYLPFIASEVIGILGPVAASMGYTMPACAPADA